MGYGSDLLLFAAENGGSVSLDVFSVKMGEVFDFTLQIGGELLYQLFNLKTAVRREKAV